MLKPSTARLLDGLSAKTESTTFPTIYRGLIALDFISPALHILLRPV